LASWIHDQRSRVAFSPATLLRSVTRASVAKQHKLEPAPALSHEYGTNHFPFLCKEMSIKRITCNKLSTVCVAAFWGTCVLLKSLLDLDHCHIRALLEADLSSAKGVQECTKAATALLKCISAEIHPCMSGFHWGINRGKGVKHLLTRLMAKSCVQGDQPTATCLSSVYRCLS